MNSYAGNGAYPASLYAATANKAPDRPALQGDHQADIVVVGGGYTGLSTALHLAESGHKVVLLEGARIGWGASGRNGGQVVNGLNASLERIGALFGTDTQRFFGGLVQEGNQIIRQRVKKYKIACDLKDGNLFAAYTDKQMVDLEGKKRLWASFGMDDHVMVSKSEMRDHVQSEVYAGGMLDRSGAHMHPLNLALGEAAAFESLGGVIHEMSPVISADTEAARPVVRTALGQITCRTLVLAGNAYLGRVVPSLTNRVLPASTQMIATEPLGERGAALLPSDICIEDVRYILDYYRLSADKRLIFGGGTVYGGTDPADIRAKLRPNLEKVFPQLKGVEITHAWSGNFAISFTRVPQMGRLGKNTYFAHGYSGHGVTGSHLFGKILSEAINGDLSRYDTFAKLRWSPFPGGRTFRVPYSVLGSWWYGLRDRLGV